MAKQRVYEFKDVLEKERTRIQTRRKKSKLKSVNAPETDSPTLESSGSKAPANEAPVAPSSVDQPTSEEPIDRVGLALSGGGIRSATVNLGILQAFYSRGLLRHVDYLSTVSGGGYVGGLLSSTISQMEKPPQWKQPDPEKPGEVLPILPDKSGRQPSFVMELTNRGRAMQRPIRFLSRHLWGLLTVNGFVISGLIALAALLAWLFRLLYLPQHAIILAQLGFRGDLGLAFCPTVCLFGLWLLASVITWQLRRKGIRVPQIAPWIYTFMVVALIMGTVATFANGDVGLNNFEVDLGLSEQMTDQIRATISWIGKGLAIAFGACILPYLRPSLIIRSGTNPRHPVEGWLFNVASYALIIGAPILIFFFMVRENISNYNENRDDRYALSRGHIRSWPRFWSLVEAESQHQDGPEEDQAAGQRQPRKESNVSGQLNSDLLKSCGPSARLWEVATSIQLDGITRTTAGDEHPIHQTIALQRRISNRDKDRWFFQRWGQFIIYAFGRDSGFEGELRDRRRLNRWRSRITDGLNDRCLSDPEFFSAFNSVELENRHELNSEGDKAIKAGYRRGALLLLRARETTLMGATTASSESGSNPPSLLEIYGLTTSQLEDARERFRVASSDRMTKARSDLTMAELRHERVKTVLADVRRNNWELIQAYFNHDNLTTQEDESQLIQSSGTVFAIVVTEADQDFRIGVFKWSFLAFLVFGIACNLNTTSLHGFYRDQLANMWLRNQTQNLHDVQTWEKGGPIPLINTALNMFGRGDKDKDNSTALLVLTPDFCGADRIGYLDTEVYDCGRETLANAMAVSGGAISPVALHNPLVRVILILCNLRLGQWLPNPKRPPGDLAWPNPLGVLGSMIFWKVDDRPFVFVTDGGHHENTAIGSLLDRRCRVVIACDASQDEKQHFADLQRLVRIGRSSHGIRFTSLHTDSSGHYRELQLDDLLADQKSGLSKEHFIILRIEYPDDEISKLAGLTKESLVGYLIYIKSTLTGDEPSDVVSFRQQHAHFPHDSTLDQFFDPERFEVYRELGEHMGHDVCNQLFDEQLQDDNNVAWLSHWTPDDGQFDWLANKLDLQDDEVFHRAVLCLEHSESRVRLRALDLFLGRGQRVPSSDLLRRRIVACLETTPPAVQQQILNEMSRWDEFDFSELRTRESLLKCLGNRDNQVVEKALDVLSKRAQELVQDTDVRDRIEALAPFDPQIGRRVVDLLVRNVPGFLGEDDFSDKARLPRLLACFRYLGDESKREAALPLLARKAWEHGPIRQRAQDVLMREYVHGTPHERGQIQSALLDAGCPEDDDFMKLLRSVGPAESDETIDSDDNAQTTRDRDDSEFGAGITD